MSTSLLSHPGETTRGSSWEALRRFEQVDVAQGLSVLEAQRRLFPTPPPLLGAPSSLSIGGGVAIHAGRQSDQNYVRGLDPSRPLSETTLGEIEAFYRHHRCPSTFVLLRLPASPLEQQLAARGYRVEQSYLTLWRPLPAVGLSGGRLPTCRHASGEERDLWSSMLMQGFLERPSPIFHAWLVGRVIFESEDACFFAQLGATPVATAALFHHDGIAVFSGDATLAPYRHRGAQQSLIHHRLQHAESLGLREAVAHVIPQTSSDRNYCRAGFVPILQRSCWRHTTPTNCR